MSPHITRAIQQAMLITGIILTPTIHADALTDLGDLKTIISSAATTIGKQTNSSRNWSFFSQPTGQLSTADLITNISTTVLHANFNLGLNQTSWINVTISDNATHAVNLSQTGVDDPYIDYVLTIPDLSAALVALGRSWHRELNKPIYDAIGALQETVSTFSNSLLQGGLIHSNSTLRTIRASSTLEDAQQAWSRILNLPGWSASSSSSPSSSPSGSSPFSYRSRLRSRSKRDIAGGQVRRALSSRDSPDVPTLVEISFEEATAEVRRAVEEARKPFRSGGRFMHKDLWGREPGPGQDEERVPRSAGGVVRRREHGRGVPIGG